jgi:hypothetical protein
MTPASIEMSMFTALDASPSLAYPRSTTAPAANRLEWRHLSPDEWHDAVADFDGISHEQLYAFAANHGGYASAEPILFLRDGEPVGGALITLRQLPLRVATIAQAQWGPMLRRNADSDADAHFADMADAIRREYGDRRGMIVSLRIPPSAAPDDTRLDTLAAQGFRIGTTWEHPQLYTLNLRQEDAAMRANLLAKWRNHLKRSETAGLTFDVAGNGGLSGMQSLYSEMLSRKKFADRTAYHTLPAVLDLAPGLRPQIFFARDAEGTILAGAVSFTAGDMAWYLYGATSDAALAVNAGHFLQWNIARWLRDNTRASWYCLGGTDGIDGLTAYKTGLAGKNAPSVLVPPTAQYFSGLRARAVGNAALLARDTAMKLRRRSRVLLQETGRT